MITTIIPLHSFINSLIFYLPQGRVATTEKELQEIQQLHANATQIIIAKIIK